MPKITLDLPFPPSVNDVWRSNRGRVHRNQDYVNWIAMAHAFWLMKRPSSEIKSIKGQYTLKIILNPPDKRRRDLGNYDKALSDFLQSAGIIENDYLCQKLSLVWGDEKDAPAGARLIIVQC